MPSLVSTVTGTGSDQSAGAAEIAPARGTAGARLRLAAGRVPYTSSSEMHT